MGLSLSAVRFGNSGFYKDERKEDTDSRKQHTEEDGRQVKGRLRVAGRNEG